MIRITLILDNAKVGHFGRLYSEVRTIASQNENLGNLNVDRGSGFKLKVREQRFTEPCL